MAKTNYNIMSLEGLVERWPKRKSYFVRVTRQWEGRSAYVTELQEYLPVITSGRNAYISLPAKNSVKTGQRVNIMRGPLLEKPKGKKS